LYHRVVEQTQISLTREQAQRLRRLARERGVSMAALIREAIDRVHPADSDDSLDARWARALAAVGGGHSGRSDIAETHDRYLEDAFGQ
jgi:predicted DNA-binding protein